MLELSFESIRLKLSFKSMQLATIWKRLNPSAKLFQEFFPLLSNERKVKHLLSLKWVLKVANKITYRSAFVFQNGIAMKSIQVLSLIAINAI